MILDEIVITIAFCCSNLWKSKFLCQENSGIFFSYFMATLTYSFSYSALLRSNVDSSFPR